MAATAELPHRQTETNYKSRLTESDAFRIEYGAGSHEAALYKDIESYLGEYRFNIPKYTYHLNYSSGNDGRRQLRDIDENISMGQRCQRAIDRRLIEGKNTDREQAELVGVQKIDSLLESARPNDTLIWLSPPGPKEDGYGDYGFCFIGNVKNNSPMDKMLEMTAIRVERANLEQFNRFASLLQQSEINYTHAEHFLANPLMLRGITSAHINSLLPEVFNFERDGNKERRFRESMDILRPNILEFINLVKSGAPKHKLQEAFNSIEVYAEKLREEIGTSVIPITKYKPVKLEELNRLYANIRPRDVAGSCGSSGKSSNPLNRYSTLASIVENGLKKKDYSFDKEGQCVVCGKDPTKVGPCSICEPCDDKIRAQNEEFPF